MGDTHDQGSGSERSTGERGEERWTSSMQVLVLIWIVLFVVTLPWARVSEPRGQRRDLAGVDRREPGGSSSPSRSSCVHAILFSFGRDAALVVGHRDGGDHDADPGGLGVSAWATGTGTTPCTEPQRPDR